MRLPVVEFGRLLGLKKPIIIGYLYGRLSVPDNVLDEARLLRLNQGSAVRELRGRFEGQPMDRIIDGWMALLGLQTAGRAKVPVDAKLAELLGVSRVTVWRWRRQIIRPELRDIDAFDRVVRVHAAGEQASERI
jgi:transcriptional regulator with XRE-family HTH domain